MTRSSLELFPGVHRWQQEGVSCAARRVRRVVVRFDLTALFISLNHGRPANHSQLTTALWNNPQAVYTLRRGFRRTSFEGGTT